MIGANPTPQVFHADSQDLAAGNFAYISGMKSGAGGTGDRYGHNVVSLVGADATLITPPGFRDSTHDDGFMAHVEWMTCAGVGGCHGMRGQMLATSDPFSPEVPWEVWRIGMSALSGYEGMGNYFRGAHHSNYDGLKRGKDHPEFSSSPLTHSYRFIRGLSGYGNEQSRWQNVDSSSHNEYFGYAGDRVDYSTASCSVCHADGMRGRYSRVSGWRQTMTSFCISCHTDFHSNGAGNAMFLRHPSDAIIKDEGEYADYTRYDVAAPVARPLGSDISAPSSVVTPGTDMVMCLSCHMAHASPYPHMLRWDYSEMITGNGEAVSGKGCFVCHSSKD